MFGVAMLGPSIELSGSGLCESKVVTMLFRFGACLVGKWTLSAVAGPVRMKDRSVRVAANGRSKAGIRFRGGLVTSLVKVLAPLVMLSPVTIMVIVLVVCVVLDPLVKL